MTFERKILHRMVRFVKHFIFALNGLPIAGVSPEMDGMRGKQRAGDVLPRQLCGVLRAASQAIWRMTFPLTMYTTISAMLVAWSAMRSRYFAI